MKLFMLVLSIFLIAGCVQQYLYVCPDGSTVSNPSYCSRSNEDFANVPLPAESIYNASQLEKEIFDLVNENRANYGLKSLLWNNEIARLAKEKSDDMAENKYFNHANLDGEVFGDILKKNHIFYLTASENIAMFGNVTSEDLATEVVKGWLESPAHRVPIIDRDEIYTDAGVGARCINNVCYFTMQFLNLERKLNINLKSGYGTFVYIYDTALDFDCNVSVMVEVNSTKATDTFVVDDSDKFDLFMQGYPIYSEREFMHNSYVSTTIVARRGYGIILYADPDWVFSDAVVGVKFRYLGSV